MAMVLSGPTANDIGIGRCKPFREKYGIGVRGTFNHHYHSLLTLLVELMMKDGVASLYS